MLEKWCVRLFFFQFFLNIGGWFFFSCLFEGFLPLSPTPCNLFLTFTVLHLFFIFIFLYYFVLYFLCTTAIECGHRYGSYPTSSWFNSGQSPWFLLRWIVIPWIEWSLHSYFCFRFLCIRFSVEPFCYMCHNCV